MFILHGKKAVKKTNIKLCSKIKIINKTKSNTKGKKRQEKEKEINWRIKEELNTVMKMGGRCFERTKD